MTVDEPAPADARLTPEQVAGALARAVAHRHARHRADPRYAHYARAALAEQVVALPEHPLPMGPGWWRIGRVLDVLADGEVVVRRHPAPGRVQTAPVPRPQPITGAPPTAEGVGADERRRRWMKPWE